MIVPMKKITLVTLNSEENSALTELRNLGVMQVELSGGVESGHTRQLIESRGTAGRVLFALEKYLSTYEECGAPASEDGRRRSGAETIAQAHELLEMQTRVNEELAAVRQKLRPLASWGDFDRADLDALRKKGIHVHLCCGTVKAAKKLAARLKNAEVHTVAVEGGRCYFAVVSLEAIPAGVLPEVALGAGDNPVELRRHEQSLENELRAVRDEIEELLPSIPFVGRRMKRIDAELEFSRVSDALKDHGKLATLVGFIPAPSLPVLEQAAEEHGWGLLIEDPKPEDRAPTLRRNSKLVSMVEPLLQFLGIEPGYEEADVSAGILIFFTIFYAIITNDAGYGLVFLAATLLAAWKFRGNPAAKAPIRLLGLLSVASIVWGVMSSSIFGLECPGWLEWAVVPQLVNPATKNAYMQFVCFSLAFLQLSLGRLWRGLHIGTFAGVVGNIGWILLLAGNYLLILRLLVFPAAFPPAMYACYGLGVLLVVVFGIRWKNVADVFQFPFEVVDSFVNSLSYIRLFAVALAGFYIAESFNDMGRSVFHSGPAWAMLIPAALVLIAGHLLNMALCLMGILVHGVRLNTLEFSGQVGLGWTGRKFKPFGMIEKWKENK